jgi:heme-degrading monooxygenase HmoA
MYVILWEFEVAAENAADFVFAYGADGTWAQIFRQSAGYIGTELLRSADAPTQYITIDRWSSAEAFKRFQQDFGDRYNALDAESEGLTLSETKIGSFTSAG